MTTLTLGKHIRSRENFRLPLAAVTSTIAILARKGRGKSYAAAVLAEELLDAGQVPVIIDITSAHWGLKSSADGKSAGYPVVIFGGEHADLPLEEGAGEIVARSIVEQRFPAIIDLSEFRKAPTYRFLASFFETLYRLNREPIHIIADEADYYAPQHPMGEQARVLGAIEDVVRRGRIKGIGITLVTQRSAAINKGVLTQADMLVAMGMNHPRDIGAIKEWVDVHGDEKKADMMIATLPALEIGTAWFWAPALDDTFCCVNIRERRTFDSGATPKAGEKVAAPKELAKIDVEKLGAQIKATVERAKENDPAELKRRIGDLQRELARKPAAAKPDVREVPVFSDADRKMLEHASADLKHLAGLLTTVKTIGESISPRLDRLIATAAAKPAPVLPRQSIVSPRLHEVARESRKGLERQMTNGTLGKCEMAILRVLANHQDGCDIDKIALLSGYRVSGGFRNSLSTLRKGGAIDGENTGTMRITDNGLKTYGPFEELPRGEALRGYWLTHPTFGACEKKALLGLLELGKATIDDLAQYTNYEVSGGFRNALSNLRTAGVIVGKNTGEMRPHPDLL